MVERTRDGGTVPGHVGCHPREGSGEHYRRLGFCRGYVQRAVYADDPKNKTGRLEYVVTISGQDYAGVIDITGPGGLFHNHQRVRKGVDTSIEGFITKGTYEEKKDGELVFCLFLEGDGDMPVIIGGDHHPLLELLNPAWTKLTAADGMVDRYEWNGLQFKIDGEGNYTITQVGKKTLPPGVPMPAPENPTAIGAKLTISKGGDFSYEGALGTKLSVTSAEDAIGMEAAFGDKITVSAADGIQASTPAAGGTSISMKGGMIDVAATVGVTVKSAAGSVEVEGVGGAKLKVGTGQVGLGGPTAELLDLFDQALAQISTMAEKAAEMATTDAAHIHGSAVGSTSPPTTASSYVQLTVDFTAAKVAVELIKTTLGTIKGGI